MSAVGIVGTGSYLPPVTVPNDLVAVPAGVTPEWIESRTAIRERRHARPDQASSDLAAHAAQRALDQAGVPASEVSCVVVATSTPDHPQPATASIVQHLIGADDAGALDVNAVCSGFVYALAVASGLLDSRRRRPYALVIGVDIYSRILDRTDRRTAVLFGDGAGAALLGPVPSGHGLIATAFRSVGKQHDLIRVPAGGSRLPPSEQTVRDGEHYFRMNGRAVRDFVHAEVPGLIGEVTAAAGIGAAEVAHFFPHQANGAMLTDVWPSLGLANAVMHLTVGRYGNTGAASIPITLDEANRRGGLAAGQQVLLAGFGGGMNLAAAICTWAPCGAPGLASGPAA